MATKHKANGLFYVTPRMLRDNYACATARDVVHMHHFARHGWPEVDTKILITLELLEKVQTRTVGTVYWFENHVPGFESAWIRHREAPCVNSSTKIMDVLWKLAIKRGLISEDHPGKSRRRK